MTKGLYRIDVDCLTSIGIFSCLHKKHLDRGSIDVFIVTISLKKKENVKK